MKSETHVADAVRQDAFRVAASSIAPAVGWATSPQTDPLTGLATFAGFVDWFADELLLLDDPIASVGVAVGDVDGLSTLIEGSASFRGFRGHLAGCAFMRDLGQRSREWLVTEGEQQACLATFGGDELIFASITRPGRASTRERVSNLQDTLGSFLPLTVSFAYSERPLADYHEQEPSLVAWDTIVTLDENMLRAKRSRSESEPRHQFLIGAPKDQHG